MQVTGGKLLYNRSVQPAPYESKALGAEWSFTVDEGENPAEASKQMVRDMMTLVHTALGLIKAPIEVVPAIARTEIREGELVKTAGKTETKSPARTRKTAEPKPEPAKVVEPESAEIIGGDVAGPQKDITKQGPLNDENFIIEAEPVVQISDADLKSACAKTAQKLGDGGAVKVKEWASKFRTDATKAFQVADIAQAERQKFLDGLEKLA